MLVKEAVKIRKEMKLFWSNYKKLDEITNKENKLNKNNYPIQYYLNLEGCGNYNIFPELTNHQLILWLTDDKNSENYPLDEDIDFFKKVLSYNK